MLPMFFISIPCLSIQSSLQKKKKQLGANFGSKELNYAKKKVSKIKLKIKKKITSIHSDL
jgi:hypothetical protein